MAIKVSFRGTTLLDSTEGAYQYLDPGSIGNDTMAIKLARARKLIIKDLGQSGALHRIRLVYRSATGSIATFRSRIEAACTPTEGVLALPDFGNIPACVMIEKPAWEAPQSAKVSGSRGLKLGVVLTFLQTGEE